MGFAGSQFNSILHERLLLIVSKILPSILLLGVFTVPSTTCAQEIEKKGGPVLTASLNTDSAHVGSIVELTLIYLLPEGAEIDSPPEITGLEGLTVLGSDVGNESIRFRLLVDQLDAFGTKEISLTYVDKEGTENVITSKPVSLKVLSNLGSKPEESQLRSIQGIIPGKPFWIKYLPWFALIFSIILIGVILYFFFKRRKHSIEALELPDPPHIKAKKEIAELEALRLFENGDIKNFYYKFSEIMRRYLENLRGFPAAEYTTEEISAKIKEEEDRTLLPLFKQADLAKFSDYVPSGARKEEEVNLALSYIDSTSPESSKDKGEDIFGGANK